jgi:hypothetical protein
MQILPLIRQIADPNIRDCNVLIQELAELINNKIE